ncbi:MAG TPA: HlyD family efflux transporter periplasmic adaptor subunit [Stenomitos sp.]
MSQSPTQVPPPDQQSPNGKLSAGRVGYYFEPSEGTFEEIPLIVARAPLYLMVGLLLIGTLFAVFAKIDQIVDGRATLMPQGKVWNLQTQAGGKVTSILVREGEPVTRGQLMVRFDKELSPESLQLLRQEVQAASRAITQTEGGSPGTLELERRFDLIHATVLSASLQDLLVQYSKARLAFIEANRTLLATIPQEERALGAQRRALNDKLSITGEMQAKGRLIQSARSRELAAQLSAKELETARMERDLGTARQRLAHYQELRTKKLIREEEVTAAEREVDQLQTGLQVARKDIERLRRSEAIARTESSTQIDTLRIDAANTQASLQDSENRLARLKSDALADFERARTDFSNLVFLLKQRLDLLNQQADFIAPVDGILTTLKVHNAGEFVSPGQLLATLAPKNAGLGAEITIANKNIGLIREGMPVKFKLNAFPYQDYGVLTGRIVQIPQDIDEKQGDYQVLAALDRSTIRTERGEVPLRYGMVATAEVITEQKRLLAVMLEPFRKKAKYAP